MLKKLGKKRMINETCFFFIKGENQPNTRANINLKFIQGKEKETGRIASYQLV